MKKRIVLICSVAVILAMVLSVVQVSHVSAMPPEPYFAEYWWEGVSSFFICEGFQVYESYHEIDNGLTHFDNEGHALRSWVNIDAVNILSRVDKPEVQLTQRTSYSGNLLYDENGNWYASDGRGLVGQIKVPMPGYGLIMNDAGHGALIWATGEWLHLTPKFSTSPEEVEAVCAYFASH